MTDDHRTNRLAKEVSPYLRQHAHNPVDWYPWGDEAHTRARDEDRPILLSIGYSACHWCHVMEHESFDDPAVAAVMNELYVNIKVDREERPDLDQIYQTTVQLMRRSGGWPLTVFLTPALSPFWAGTYFPPVDRYGMPGFPTVLRAVHDAYTNKRDDVERTAGELTAAISRVISPSADPDDPPADLLVRSASTLSRRIDPSHGGFGTAPKFPNTMALDVLLRRHRRDGDEDTLGDVVAALDSMRAGGIWDHLGGGFHRYSTDERWLVPHFEKMLYDNALLVRLYVDAWRQTGHGRFESTARDTLAYVKREMCSPEGAFWSTQDADSEGEEGRFFVWTAEQIREVLGEDDAKVVEIYFGVSPGGNFEHGATVLHENRAIEVVARQLGRDPGEVREALDGARARLFDARESREKPFRDEKVITAWNGLMIGAFAEAGGAFGDDALIDTARAALAFHRDHTWLDGSLRRIWKDGEARIEAFLDDYGSLAGAALDVFEAAQDPEALSFARALCDAALARFEDRDEGGFFFSQGGDDLLVRAKDAYDNAVPSGTSTMTHALLRLHALTDDARYLTAAERALRALARVVAEHPFGFGHMIGAMDRYTAGSTEVVIVAEPDDPAGDSMLRLARAAYLPNRSLIRVSPTAGDGEPGAAALGGRRQQGGAATAYVCEKRVCGAPVSDPGSLAEILTGRS